MYKLHIARPCGHKLESPEIGTYLMQLGYRLGHDPDFTTPGAPGLVSFSVSNPRIRMMRNMCVAAAQQAKSTHIFWLDPDQGVDAYHIEASDRGQSSYEEFFPSAWAFMKRHPGPCILAAPYCGCSPSYPVQVFCPNERGEVVRVKRETAARLRGWHAVSGVGLGVCLMDMRVFDILPHPYFSDEYTDITETKLARSSDVHFCLRAAAAGIPTYVNFSAPARHWQLEETGWPGARPTQVVEKPLPVANNPSVPVLVEPGAGDRSWK